MNNELIKNLSDYFNNYEESVKMFESGDTEKSKYPCYKSFYNIKNILRKISETNELYLDTKHSNTEFTTNYSKKLEPTMAIYYKDGSKECRKGDGIYIYIMYPNKKLKQINISIELGYRERFQNKDDIYIECIKNIKEQVPEYYKEKYNCNSSRNIITQAISIETINNFEEVLLEFFKMYKIIIKKINELKGANYNEKYDAYMKLINKEVSNEPRKNISYNIIYYGIPGSGKSYYIKNKLLKNLQIVEYERVTFYPEYTYSDFVGTYKISNDKEKPIKLQKGPFTRMLIKALKDKNNNYALVIEELNRGYAEAIFGDIFQLLDRKNGESEYYINNDFIKECMEDEDVKQEKIKIPNNLYVIATINTSDQNVFNLDTAFGRRWEYERIDDNFSMENDEEKYSEKYIKGFKNIKWNDFRTQVNKNILKPENNIWNKEDKQLGLFYISKEQLYLHEQQIKNEKEERKKFVYKVIRYLWFDVFKNEEEKLINVLNTINITENELKLCNSFDELAKQIIEQ